MRRALIAFAILFPLACTQDFDELLPQGDAGDATTDVADAPVDTGCTPLPSAESCFDAAAACGDACTKKRTTCESGCSTGACRKACRDDEFTCKSKCIADCTSCTKAVGCAATATCTTKTG